MIRRTADAGLGALVLTVDVPVGSKRERNISNGFANVRGGLLQALSLKPSILAEALTHPGWIVEYLRHGGGTPMLQNWQPYAPNGADAEAVYNFSRSLMPFNAQTWRDLEELPAPVPARARRQGHHEPGRCAALPPRSAATESSSRTMAGGSSTRRRPRSTSCRRSRRRSATSSTVMLDSGVTARRRHPDRAVPRREIRLYGPADALRRRGRRHSRGQQGDLDLRMARSTWSWARSAARASTSSAPISCGQDDWQRNAMIGSESAGQ